MHDDIFAFFFLSFVRTIHNPPYKLQKPVCVGDCDETSLILYLSVCVVLSVARAHDFLFHDFRTFENHGTKNHGPVVGRRRRRRQKSKTGNKS
jgi:hypothetical protein